MSIFQRTIRLFLWVSAGLTAFVLAAVAILTRMVLQPSRQPLWADPGDIHLPYETVQFPARDDGLRLSGWFIPATQSDTIPSPTIIMAHGWTWNRLGDYRQGWLSWLLRLKPVNFLPLVQKLQAAGFHILMLDLRNHGESASDEGVTFGYKESNDILGAIDYLQTRSDIDRQQIHLLGFSIGANSIIYALPRTDAVATAVLVQPIIPLNFLQGLTKDVLGILGQPVLLLSQYIIRQFGGMNPAAIQPAFAAASFNTPLLLIQAAGDHWSQPTDVQQIMQHAPSRHDEIILPDTTHRYDGYQYLLDHENIMIDFIKSAPK